MDSYLSRAPVVSAVYHTLQESENEPDDKSPMPVKAWGKRERNSLQDLLATKSLTASQTDDRGVCPIFKKFFPINVEDLKKGQVSRSTFYIVGDPGMILFSDQLDSGLYLSTAYGRVELDVACDRMGLRASRPLYLTKEMKNWTETERAVTRGFPVHYFRMILDRGDGKVLVVRRSFAYSRGRILKSGQAADGVLYVTYLKYWEKRKINFSRDCQLDLYHSLRDPFESGQAREEGEYCMTEDNVWEEGLVELEPRVGLRYCKYSQPTKISQPRKSYGSARVLDSRPWVDPTMAQDFSWHFLPGVGEAETRGPWYSCGYGSNFGAFRRELRCASASGDLTASLVTYLKLTQIENVFGFGYQDANYDLVDVRCKKLPSTTEDLEALFKLWDFHAYSPSHYLFTDPVNPDQLAK